MKLQGFVVAALVVGLMSAGMFLIAKDFNTSYGVSIDTGKEGDVKAVMDQTTYDVINMSNKIKLFNPGKADAVSIFIPYQFLTATWELIKIIFTSVWNMTSLMTSWITIIGTAMGLGPIVGILQGVVNALILAGVVFIILYAWFKWQFSD